MLESYDIFVINMLRMFSLQTPHQFGRTTQNLMGSYIEIQYTQTLQVINYNIAMMKAKFETKQKSGS